LLEIKNRQLTNFQHDNCSQQEENLLHTFHVSESKMKTKFEWRKFQFKRNFDSSVLVWRTVEMKLSYQHYFNRQNDYENYPKIIARKSIIESMLFVIKMIVKVLLRYC
jgi:hypothetical protein